MTDMKEIHKILNLIKSILQSEKECLVKSDIERLESLIGEKHSLIDLLKSSMEEPCTNSVGFRDLVDEIKSLQQTNIMLTKQAMCFQNALFRALGEGENSRFKTYDAIGRINGKSDASIIDHSV